MNEQEEKQKRIFDQEFKKYTSYRLATWQQPYISRIFTSLDLNRNDLLLDIGVGGSGYTVIEAAKIVEYTCGIDLSKEGIKKARYFAKQIGLQNTDFVVSSAENLPFKDATFTKLCSIAVMEHVEDDSKAFDEISRVIVKGGRIHICVPNSYVCMSLLLGIANLINDKKVGHLRHYYPNDLIRCFEKRGFKLLELEYHAHNVKLLSYFLDFIPLPAKFKDTLLSFLDDLDRAKKDEPDSMNFSVTMIKEK